MTIYIRPYGDDKNDGSEKAPVKSPKRAIAIANRNNVNEINLLSTDWARINGRRGGAVPTGRRIGKNRVRARFSASSSRALLFYRRPRESSPALGD